MKVKFLEAWSHYKPGDIHPDIHPRKAKPLIEAGIAEETKATPKPKAAPLPVETAEAAPPIDVTGEDPSVESADDRPKIARPRGRRHVRGPAENGE